jgi:acyl carrier protein
MDKVVEILAAVFRIKAELIDDNLTKANVPRWDSLTHMDMITSLEEHLNIQFDMNEIVEMQDFTTIKRLINKKLGS